MKGHAIVATVLLLTSSVGHASIIYADTVIDYFHSGVTGPASGSFAPGFGFGGPPNGTVVPLTNAIDEDTGTFVSLPTDSFITLGFSTGFVFDGAGDDLFVDEIGNGAEDADLFVSDDFGATFTFLSKVFGNQTNSLDFADFMYTGNVNAVKLVGLDNGGGSPGFDVTAVWGLEDSTVLDPQGPASVPGPATVPLLMGCLLLLGLRGRNRHSV